MLAPRYGLATGETPTSKELKIIHAATLRRVSTPRAGRKLGAPASIACVVIGRVL
jgi:hypothetical protein